METVINGKYFHLLEYAFYKKKKVVCEVDNNFLSFNVVKNEYDSLQFDGFLPGCNSHEENDKQIKILILNNKIKVN